MSSSKEKYTFSEKLCDDIRFASRSYRRKLALRNPEAAIRLNYQHTCKKKLNLEHPTTLPEAIQWLKLHSDTSLWPTLADKFTVRNYVKSCGLEHHLNALLATYHTPQEIDWKALPNQLVLKLSNGCHSVLPIPDKHNISFETVTKQFDKWMKHPFGLESAEFHYQAIEPLIIAEKYLHQSPSLIDYKIYCIGGKAEAILHCQDRHKGKATKTLLNTQWQVIPEYNTRTILSDEIPPQPTSLSEMVAAAEKLSQPFSFVRVDYYEIDNKPIFGEMTFTPAGGYKPYGSELFYEIMGQKIMNLYAHE